MFVILHQNDKMICRAVLEAQYNDTVAILHSEGPSQQRHNKDKTSLCHAAMLMHLTSNNTIIIIITILIKLTLDVCCACLVANLCCLNNRLTKPTWTGGSGSKMWKVGVESKISNVSFEGVYSVQDEHYSCSCWPHNDDNNVGMVKK